MIKIGPATLEIARITTAPFWTRRQKISIFTKYLNNYWTDLHQTSRVSSHMYGDYKTDISFAVAQGMLLVWGIFVEVKIDCFYSLLWRLKTD